MLEVYTHARGRVASKAGRPAFLAFVLALLAGLAFACGGPQGVASPSPTAEVAAPSPTEPAMSTATASPTAMPTATPTVEATPEPTEKPPPPQSEATPEVAERTELHCGEKGWVETTVNTDGGPVRVSCAIQPVGKPILALPCGPDYCEHRSPEEWVRKAELVSRRVKAAGFDDPCDLGWVAPAKYNTSSEELDKLDGLLGCEK